MNRFPYIAAAPRGVRAPWVLVVTSVIAACDGGERAPLGRVVVGLGEDVCADYCLTALRATLFREGQSDLPLGPSLQAGCGEELTFQALPAGERFEVAMQGFDVTGELLLEGRSEALTIVADGVSEAHVSLGALSVPTVSEVDPDPVVLAPAGATIRISGSFGQPLGAAGVELGGRAYSHMDDALSWTGESGDDTIALALPSDAVGGPLVVRRCGIASDAFDLRVIGAAPGEAAVTVGPACAGATPRAALVSGSVLVAWGCADGAGALMSFELDDALCPLDPGPSWTIDDLPDALAALGDRVYVGGSGGLRLIDRSIVGGDAIRVTGVGQVRALAATASEVYGIVSDEDHARVVRVGDAGASDVVGIDVGLVPVALAASAERLFVAAHTADGEGRLISVPTGGVVAVYSLAGQLRCDAPLAIAVAPDGSRVAIACAGAGLALWHVADQTLTLVTTSAELEALAFDDTDDVVFGAERSGSGLAVFDLEARGELHRFARTARAATSPALLTRLGRHRLLMPSATAPLAVLTPFDGAGPCAATAIGSAR